MQKKYILNLLLLFVFFAFSGIMGTTKSNEILPEEKMTIPGQIIVKLKAPLGDTEQVNMSALSSIANEYGAAKTTQLFSEAKNGKIKKKLNLNNVFVLEITGPYDTKAIIAELSANPNVEYAEPVYISKVEATVNDPRFSDQPHLLTIMAPQAWDIHSGPNEVVVGIIDSGVDWDHEDLAANIWNNDDEIPDNGIDDDNNGFIDDTRGWDFVTGRSGEEDTDAMPDEDAEDPDNDPMDFGGHGTHVAGIVGAVTNNEIGVASASYGAKLMPLRIGWKANDGTGYVSSLFAAEAYIYAADNGADVTNQSSGNSGQAIIDAAYYAFLNGVLIVESAGNGDANDPSALGAQDWVLCVASTTNDDIKTGYSNFGEFVKVSAPGGAHNPGILSSYLYPSNLFEGKYGYMSGTSMAAPLVASAAALVKSYKQDLDVIELFDQVVKTTDPINALNPDYIDMLGSGRINLERALNETTSSSPKIVVQGTSINELSGNGNGFLDPGEQVELEILIKNEWASASNVNLSVATMVPWPVAFVTSEVTISSLPGALDPENSLATAKFTLACAEDAFPITVPVSVSITADNFELNTEVKLPISPNVLFVADFENNDNKRYDYSHYFEDAFEEGLVSYDKVDHLRTPITAELLGKYETVVWGCEWFFPTLDENDRNVLRTYLDNGGALFISGQDLAWDINENDGNIDQEFLHNYLNINFVADNAGRTEVVGVEGDPIGDELNVNFYQKLRDDDQQFPDVVEPINGSVPVFQYKNGTVAATRYDGIFDVVYFGFGGFEAIDDPEQQTVIMKRTVNWLSGIEYDFEPLPDNESTTENYPVEFNAASKDGGISSVKLYYNTGDELSINVVELTEAEPGKYTGEIPAQSDQTLISYIFYAQSDHGDHIVTQPETFFVGPDQVPPMISVLTHQRESSIGLKGLGENGIFVSMADNIGIDQTTAKITYRVNEGTSESNPLELVDSEKNLFYGTFSFDEELNIGDKVEYAFEVYDLASTPNFNSTEMVSYTVDTNQVVDDFEFGISDWSLEGTWGLSILNTNGEFSLSDSPGGNYENDVNYSATYIPTFDLSPYKWAEMELAIQSSMEKEADSLFVEVSNDGGNTWVEAFGYSKNSFRLRAQTVDLIPFTGEGYESVQFRLRFKSDSENVMDGVWIDDISLTVSFDQLVSVDDMEAIPLEYSLKQNYPNPFNPATTLKYSLKYQSKVTLEIYDVLGRRIDMLINKEQQAGRYELNYDASHLTSGVYFYRINASSANGDDFVKTMKMILLK